MSTTAIADLHGASLRTRSLGGYNVRAVRGHMTNDGAAWSANVYLGNTKIGTADQRGDGGITLTHIDPEHREAFEAHAETWDVEASFGEYTFREGKFDFIDALLDEYEVAKNLRAQRRKGNLPILSHEQIAALGGNALTTHSLLPGGVTRGSAGIDTAKFPLYFDGEQWVPFEA